MYTTLWKKYLPVIRIVLKWSLREEQTLDLNVTDFERAGVKRKSSLPFLMTLKNGKLRNVIVNHPLASDLAMVLLEDAAIEALMASNEFHIGLNTKCQLAIKHIAETNAAPEEAVVIETA